MENVKTDIIRHLESVIQDRRQRRPAGSYTAYLFEAGQDKILKKLAEETGETIIASKNHSREEIIYEAADLVYHLLVLLRFHDISWADIEAELANRHQPNPQRQEEP